VYKISTPNLSLWRFYVSTFFTFPRLYVFTFIRFFRSPPASSDAAGELALISAKNQSPAFRPRFFCPAASCGVLRRLRKPPRGACRGAFQPLAKKISRCEAINPLMHAPLRGLAPQLLGGFWSDQRFDPRNLWSSTRFTSFSLCHSVTQSFSHNATPSHFSLSHP
jgi:hypothetical protein